MALTQESVLSSIGGGDLDFGSLAAELGPNLFGIVTSILGSVFGLFTFALFAFYFSADMPRLERWVARLFPARAQGVVQDVWHITAQKTGSYVGARVILALVCSVSTGIVFAVIGMPYWLPLAMWTGIVAAVRADHRHLHRDHAARARRAAQPEPVARVLPSSGACSTSRSRT